MNEPIMQVHLKKDLMTTAILQICNNKYLSIDNNNVANLLTGSFFL